MQEKKSIERWDRWSHLTSAMGSSLTRLPTELAREEMGPSDGEYQGFDLQPTENSGWVEKEEHSCSREMRDTCQ